MGKKRLDKHRGKNPLRVPVRITNIKDYINNPHKPKITLSNETVSGSVSSTLKELQSTEVVIDENHRAALQFTKRRFRDARGPRPGRHFHEPHQPDSS